VHRAKKVDETSADQEEFHLFDGQQRMTAILLGLDQGQMKDNRRLWVDFPAKENRNTGLIFQLRMSSSGQPFGYRFDAPNQKIPLGKRSAKWEEWREKGNDDKYVQNAFGHAASEDLIDSECAIPFREISVDLLDNCQSDISDKLANKIRERLAGKAENIISEAIREARDFICKVNKALNSKVLLQLLDPEIVAHQDEYIRFFGRLGQGGTRLSDDELTYSIIKYAYPDVRARMMEIMKDNQAGHLAGEVDLVLAALRVAKVLRPWSEAKEWQVICRPNPEFVSQLKEKERMDVEEQFLRLLNPQDEHGCILKTAVIKIREALSYDPDENSAGLPDMLLARLPRELVDVLILFFVNHGDASCWKEDGRKVLCPFVLYWLIFVGDDRKAADRVFQHAYPADENRRWQFSLNSIRDLIEEYEQEGIARVMPRSRQLPCLYEEVNKSDHHLRPWAERFKSLDQDSERKPGDALRVLSTNRELAKRALIWLQRKYIVGEYPDYKPTSDRDDDLPIDLDHLIPYSVFGFDWRLRDKRLDADAISDNFHWERGTAGNSIGNFRWLDARVNRRRGNNQIEPVKDDGDLISNLAAWNDLIGKSKWSEDEISTFQRLIDLRTLDLYRELLDGIDFLLAETPSNENSAPLE